MSSATEAAYPWLLLLPGYLAGELSRPCISQQCPLLTSRLHNVPPGAY